MADETKNKTVGETESKVDSKVETEAVPNVVFVGRRRVRGGEEFLDEAPSKLISGPKVFDDLPDFETQKSGFYHPEAAELCRAFPGLYKPITKKGE